MLRDGTLAMAPAEGRRSRLVQELVRRVLRPIAAGGRKREALPSGRRILLLHLDGVGKRQLDYAMARGIVPTLQRLLDTGPYRLSPCRAGAPTSTPAFQAGLLYGTAADIPGYTWFDKRARRAVRMDSGVDARSVEAQLTASGTPLLRDGSVYCSIFSGGAKPRRWALSGIDEALTADDFGGRAPLGQQARDALAATLVHAATAGRIATDLGLDLGAGMIETARWIGQVGSMQHERQFLFHRVLTECLFAEFAANSCVVDIARGTPIVYACFIGYDEYAHRRGPYSAMAMLKLWELDRALGRIIAAVNAVPELNYELYLFSDHGQVATRPAEQILGESLGEHLLADSLTAPLPAAGGEGATAVANRARQLRSLSRALPGVFGKAALAWARHTAKPLDGARPDHAAGPLLVVPAGDIGHVYSTASPEPLTEPEIRARHPGLLERCAHSPAIGVTLVRGERGPIALRGDRRLELDRADGAQELAKALGHPLAASYARDLLRMRSAGDAILLGNGAPGGQAVAFPWEFGSHGGISSDELDTFMVHPAALGQDAFAHVERPQDLHAFFQERSGRAVHDEERRAAND